MPRNFWSHKETERFKKEYPFRTMDELLKIFPNRTYRSLEKKAVALRLKKDSSFKGGDEMAKKRITIPEAVDKILLNIKDMGITQLPDVKVPKIKGGKGDEEEIVVKLSDWQLGHKTSSFNYRVAERRVHHLLKKVFKIVALHRKGCPVRKINLFLEGDFIQSDKVGYLIDLSELEGILIDQVYREAVPLLSWFIAECAKNFEKVNVYCVRGNHGRGEKGSSEKNNWDDVIYKTLETKFENVSNVKFVVAREFYQVVSIFKWKFLLAHGDQIRGGSYNIPLYGLLQRMLRWATSMSFKWNFLSVGHWHTFAHIEQNDQELFVNGTLVSDDEYVRKNYGWNASTSQTLFGVHPRQGVCWVRKINLKNIK